MNKDTQLNQIRQACIRANLEIVEVTPNQDAYGGFDPEWHPRTIRLADVLEAVRTAKGGMWARYNGVMTLDQWVADFLPMYDLRKDDLTQQSDECIAFLAHLLG